MNPIISIKGRFLKFISKRKTRPVPQIQSPKFILLMHQSIGDMIVFSSLIREIKSGYQNPSIQVIASKKNIDIAKQNPYIDKVFLYENKWSKLFPLLLNLRSINFHYAIELEAKVVTRVILMLKIISPQCILSVSKREGRYGLKPQDVLPYDYYTNENLNHQSDTSLDILRLINIKVTDKSYDFFYSGKHRARAKLFFSKFDNQKTIALNLAGSSNTRRFLDSDVEKILVGLRQIIDNLTIILLHEPKDIAFINQFINEENSTYVVASYPTISIMDVGALIDNVNLLITPDTSLVHIACALEVPLLAIYANDMETFDAWHPKSKCSQVIFSDYFDSLNNLNITSIINKSIELIKL